MGRKILEKHKIDKNGFPGGSVVKNLPAKQETRVQSLNLEDPLEKEIPTPVFLPGKSNGQRRLAGYSPWGHKRVGHDLVSKQQEQMGQRRKSPQQWRLVWNLYFLECSSREAGKVWNFFSVAIWLLSFLIEIQLIYKVILVSGVNIVNIIICVVKNGALPCAKGWHTGIGAATGNKLNIWVNPL